MANAPSAGMQRLIDVVAQLRDPTTGCPWDLEQTHASLVPYVLEEAHEVADAIRHGDDNHLKEELGDLLLQVVLHPPEPQPCSSLPASVLMVQCSPGKPLGYPFTCCSAARPEIG